MKFPECSNEFDLTLFNSNMPAPMPKVPSFSPQKIQITSSSVAREDLETVDMKGLMLNFPSGIKQVVVNLNKERLWDKIKQREVAAFAAHFGRNFIQALPGINDLRTIDNKLNEIADNQTIEAWKTSATSNMNIKGNMKGRWSGKIIKDDKEWYASLADDLRLSKSFVLQVGMAIVLMQADVQLIRQDWREEYKQLILEFKNWIPERIKFGKNLIAIEKNGDKKPLKEQSLTFAQDILGICA